MSLQLAVLAIGEIGRLAAAHPIRKQGEAGLFLGIIVGQMLLMEVTLVCLTYPSYMYKQILKLAQHFRCNLARGARGVPHRARASKLIRERWYFTAS